MTDRQIAYVLLALSLIGLGLLIFANQWNEFRRFKIAVVFIIIGYCAAYGLR